MKYVLISAISILFCVNAGIFSQDELPLRPNVLMKCKAPKQGPPGPRGPAGSLATHYASTWSVTAQEIPPGNTQVDVIFDNDQIPAVGILHPVSGDDALFQIQRDGVYLIIWNVTSSYFAAEPNTNTTVNFTLFNVSTGTSINPGFNGSATLTNEEAKTITGQTSLFLPAGTIIKLQVANERAIMQIVNRTLTITQIAKKNNP